MVRYAPLSNPAVNPDEEMDAAFENSDDEDEELSSENAHKPLLRRAQDHPLSPDHRSAPPSPGVTDNAEAGPSYNFEYDYDFPPPGSPPRPSALALPNEFGNTNGQLPQNSSIPRSTQPAIFRRMLDAVRPSHRTAGVVGGGMSNDGVFGNVMAKPGGTGPRVGEEESDGPFWAPELVQKEAPPSYAAAQLDAVPGYWENTILAPSDPNFGDLMIEGLPTGSIFAFLWNALFSMSFQFVGFLLTHLLAGSHASKFGSRAGLGVTLIQYGFFLRAKPGASYDSSDGFWAIPADPADPTSSSPSTATRLLARALTAVSNSTVPTDQVMAEVSATNDWISFFLMTLGWFIFLSSFLGFWRIKRIERSIRMSNGSVAPPRGTRTGDREQLARMVQHFQRMFDRDALRNGLGLGRRRAEATSSTEDLAALEAGNWDNRVPPRA